MARKTKHTLPHLAGGEWNVVCDFDGTITPFDVTDAILERFADPEWEVVEKEWLDGDITARSCMERQIGMIKAAPEELDAFLETVPLTAGVLEFMELCAGASLEPLIVSDGTDYAIRRTLERHGLVDAPVVANRLRFHGDSGCRLEFPYGAPGCASGVCKCKVAAALGGKTLLIGDGRSDICLAGNASFVMAKRGRPLHRHCLENHTPHMIYDDFFDVLNAFALMLPRAARARERDRPRPAQNHERSEQRTSKDGAFQ